MAMRADVVRCMRARRRALHARETSCVACARETMPRHAPVLDAQRSARRRRPLLPRAAALLPASRCAHPRAHTRGEPRPRRIRATTEAAPSASRQHRRSTERRMQRERRADPALRDNRLTALCCAAPLPAAFAPLRECGRGALPSSPDSALHRRRSLPQCRTVTLYGYTNVFHSSYQFALHNASLATFAAPTCFRRILRRIPCVLRSIGCPVLKLRPGGRPRVSLHRANPKASQGSLQPPQGTATAAAPLTSRGCSARCVPGAWIRSQCPWPTAHEFALTDAQGLRMCVPPPSPHAHSDTLGGQRTHQIPIEC
eukprot:4357964-Pleurochrysis_carterae.AAC.1